MEVFTKGNYYINYYQKCARFVNKNDMGQMFVKNVITYPMVYWNKDYWIKYNWTKSKDCVIKY